MKYKIAVVIPNWNGEDLIKECLNSLLIQSVKCEVIVVDNGSMDGSVNLIKKHFPKVTLLEFEDNAGFAGGVNRGISYALKKGFEYIALFNNDAVADKNWLKNLIKEFDDEKIGIVTGKFLRSDKKHIDSTGDFYTIWGLPYPRGRNQEDNGQFNKKQEVFGASGGASLYRSELFKDIGLFDEDFFAYYEDVDISLRAQMAGWKIIYIPKAIAYHGIGGTSSKMGDFTRYHSAKNFLLLYSRNLPTKLYLKYLPFFTIQLLRMAVSSFLRGKFIVFTKGTLAAIKLHKKTKVERKHNLAKQKVSDEYINSIIDHSRPPKIPVI